MELLQLRRFTTSLIEQGYADETVRLKLVLLTNFGQWLRRNNLAVTSLERLVEAFLKRKHRVHKGNLRKRASQRRRFEYNFRYEREMELSSMRAKTGSCRRKN